MSDDENEITINHDHMHKLEYKSDDTILIKKHYRSTSLCIHCGYGDSVYEIRRIDDNFYLFKYFQCLSYDASDGITVLWEGDRVESLPSKYSFVMNDEEEDVVVDQAILHKLQYKTNDVIRITKHRSDADPCSHCGNGSTIHEINIIDGVLYLTKYFECLTYNTSDDITVLWKGDSIDSLPDKYKFVLGDTDETS